MADSKDKKTTASKVKTTATASKAKTTAAKAVQVTTSNTLTASTLPTADALKDRFKAGSIPLQTDFADLIDMAETGRRAVGGAPDQTGPGAGFKLDDNGTLQLKLDETYAGKDYAPVKIYADILTVDLGSGLVSESNGICVGQGNGIVVNASDISVKSGNGITVDSNGVHINPNTVLPKGIITMFSGSDVPEGWLFCDGSNGTPDLRDRFILSGSINDVGGQSSTTYVGPKNSKAISLKTDSQSVNISGKTQGHALTSEENGPHSHYTGVAVQQSSKALHEYKTVNSVDWLNAGGTAIGDGKYEPRTDADGSGKAHSHDLNLTTGSHSHTSTLTIPYYILAFIMKS